MDTAGNQLPYIDGMSWPQTAEPQVRILKALAGEVDMDRISKLTSDFTALKKGEKKGNYTTRMMELDDHANMLVLIPNQDYNGDEKEVQRLMREKSFRQAVSIGMDRDTQNQILGVGLSTPAQSVLLPTSPGGSKETEAKYTKTDIAKIMKLGDPVLVQVVKEPMGSKGARLTSNISIPGRHLVLLPNAEHRGVSKKIQNKGERDRLKKMIAAFEMPKNMGLICRTASTEASIETLVEEAKELLAIWENITEKFNSTNKTARIKLH